MRRIWHKPCLNQFRSVESVGGRGPIIGSAWFGSLDSECFRLGVSPWCCFGGEGHAMPAFSFEKISPPARRGPAAAASEKPRGVISQVIDRLTDRSAGRRPRQERDTHARDEKPSN
jgi:hypothetical protein